MRCIISSFIFVAFNIGSCVAATPITAAVRSFGHSIKNGNLPPKAELEVFAHNCSAPPCIVTQVHLPSIYPRHEVSIWQDGRFRMYIDGERVASFDLLVREISLLGRKSVNGTQPPEDGSPWGLSLFGHTAKNGGVYTTIRVPFSRHLRVTMSASQAAAEASTFWMIIRGLEATPVTLGDLLLPESAKLRIARTDKALQDLEMITIANASQGGALLLTKFDADAPTYTYLEACLRLLADGNENPMFLSSGAEDYFLSSSYFDEGMFKTEESGLTYFDHKGSLSAYKTHLRDPVVWQKSMQLIWRCGEVTTGCGDMAHCPDRFCPPGYGRETIETTPTTQKPWGTPAHYATLVMFYTWPKIASSPSAVSIAGALSRLSKIGLPQDEFEIISDRILSGDQQVLGVLGAEIDSEKVHFLLAKLLGRSAHPFEV